MQDTSEPLAIAARRDTLAPLSVDDRGSRKDNTFVRNNGQPGGR
jgi:hypothetical protein